MTTQGQISIPGWDERFLDERKAEALEVIKACAARSTMPLVLQFSGGRDSMALLGLVREAEVPADKYICSYMATGTELPGVVTFVRDFCKQEGLRLLVSQPGLHKGNIYKRIQQFRSFPNLGSFDGGGKRLWCCRDLKLRPQKKLLVGTFGKGEFFKLEGIRRFESDRRKVIYRQYAATFMREDDEFKKSWEVFPILNWSDDDVLQYLEQRGLPTMGQYKEFGVSGCSWCPFYPPEIYAKVLAVKPNWYDRFISLEEELNQPSVHGGVFLRDIKSAVLEGRPIPEVRKGARRAPCTMMFNGVETPTCQVYGHLFIDGKCYRCDEPEVKP